MLFSTTTYFVCLWPSSLVWTAQDSVCFFRAAVRGDHRLRFRGGRAVVFVGLLPPVPTLHRMLQVTVQVSQTWMDRGCVGRFPRITSVNDGPHGCLDERRTIPRMLLLNSANNSDVTKVSTLSSFLPL